jgi:hypothetical protein
MKIELRKTSDIKPYSGNPRVNDDAVDASLKEAKCASRLHRPRQARRLHHNSASGSRDEISAHAANQPPHF